MWTRLSPCWVSWKGKISQLVSRRSLSAAASRRKMAAAQKARWAKVRGQSGLSNKANQRRPRRTLSAAARKKIAAAQRARWAKVRAATVEISLSTTGNSCRRKNARNFFKSRAFDLLFLDSLNVLSLPALGAFGDVELHCLAFLQAAKAPA